MCGILRTQDNRIHKTLRGKPHKIPPLPPQTRRNKTASKSKFPPLRTRKPNEFPPHFLRQKLQPPNDPIWQNKRGENGVFR